MSKNRNAMRIFLISTFVTVVSALEVGIFSPKYSSSIYLLAALIVIGNFTYLFWNLGSEQENFHLTHGYYIVAGLAFLLQNTTTQPKVGMTDIGLYMVVVALSYCVNFYKNNNLTIYISNIFILTSFFFLLNTAYELKVNFSYFYLILTLLFAPFVVLAKKLNFKNDLYTSLSIGSLVILDATLTINNLINWGKNDLLGAAQIILITINLTLIIAAILIVKLPKFLNNKSLAVLTSFMVLISIAVFAPSNNAFSQSSVLAIEKKLENQTRATSVAGYRLPGVGYKKELSGKTFQECDQASTQGRDCFITYYVDMAKKVGVKATLDDIINAMNTHRGSNLSAHCHQVTHAVGQFSAGTEFKKDPLAGLKLEPEVCATGYTHGIFETFWKPYDNKEMTAKTPDACSNLGMVVGYYRWTCNHILGHELVIRDELNPGPQLRACLTIDDDHSINDCLSGGWMQFFSDDPILAMFKSKNSTAKDIFAYCDREVLRMQRMCYQETFPALSIVKNSNFTSEMNDCSLASDDQNKKWCIQGVARAIAITGNYTVPYAMSECAKLTGDTRDYCYSASAASITLNMGSASDTKPMCDMVVAKATKDYCFRWVRDSRSLIASGPNKQNMPVQ